MSIHSDFFNPLLDQMMAVERGELLVHAGSRPYIRIVTPDGVDVKPLENSVTISPDVLVPALESLKGETGSTFGAYRHDDHRFRWYVSGDTISFRYIPILSHNDLMISKGLLPNGPFTFIDPKAKTSQEDSE